MIEITLRYVIYLTPPQLLSYSNESLKFNNMAIDWTKIYETYKGLWVALLEDEVTVVASGKTAKEAWDEAQKKGVSKPILARMPSELVILIGSPHYEV